MKTNSCTMCEYSARYPFLRTPNLHEEPVSELITKNIENVKKINYRVVFELPTS